MGQITVRELENMDFFKEIPKDILQNLLNESKVVSYKKKEVIFYSRSRTKTVYFVYSGEVMLYNLTKHGNRKVIFILGKGRLLNQSILNTYKFVKEYINPNAPGGKERVGYIIDRVGFAEYKKWALDGVELLPETIVKDNIYWSGIHYR